MNSDLQDFVKETLVQIVRGIESAQREVSKHSAIINPKLAEKRVRGTQDETKDDNFGHGYRLDRDNISSASILETMNGGIASIVEFDVAVTTSIVQSAGTETSSNKEAGVRLKVVSAGVDFGSESSRSLVTTNDQISRVKFKVPVMYPQGQV